MLLWIPYSILFAGIFLLIIIPFLIHKLRDNPLSVLRPVWRDTLSPRFATVLGILLILVALLGGLWAIWTGIVLLFYR